MRESFIKEGKLSKKEWIDFIASTLKAKSIEDFKWEIHPELHGNVFSHEDDLDHLAQNMASNGKGNWKTGLVYKKGLEIQSDLLEGVESLYFEDNNEISYLNNNISQSLEIISEFKLNQNEYSIKGSKSCVIYPKLFEKTFLEIDEQVLSKNKVSKIGVRFDKMTGDDSPVDKLSDFFKDFSKWVEEENINKEQLIELMQRLSIEYSLSTEFLFEISFLRALKLLMFNFQKSYDIDPVHFSLIAIIDLPSLAAGRNDQLILAPTVAIAGILANADSIFLDPGAIQGADAMEISRLCRNVLLILKNESSMDLVKDPIAGSYAIESLAGMIAEKSWEKMACFNK